MCTKGGESPVLLGTINKGGEPSLERLTLIRSQEGQGIGSLSTSFRCSLAVQWLTLNGESGGTEREAHATQLVETHLTF